MKKLGVTSMIAILIFASAMAMAAKDRGAEKMTLDGGKNGPVFFPHHAHQDNLGDCKVCHDIFPQEAGTIQKKKAAGELEKKQIMNKQCLACHRKMKKAGEPTGPTSCQKCHHKEK